MALFTTNHTALTRAIAEMNALDVRDAVGALIFQRGESYYAKGATEDLEYTDEDTLEATVSGSDFYSVVVYRDDNEIDADCSCPFDGYCKHIVAVLLEAIREGSSVQGFQNAKPRETASAEDSNNGDGGDISVTLASLGQSGAGASKEFQEYIATLSLEELRALVLRYAPEEFRRAALAQALNASDAEKAMSAAERAVGKMFANLSHRHASMYELEKDILRQCNNIRGLWGQFPLRVAETLTDIIASIDNAIDDGAFYDEYSEEIFESPDFEDYVVRFIRETPPPAKDEVISQIKEAIANTNYYLFRDILARKMEWYSAEELPALKASILTQIRKKTYLYGDAEIDYQTLENCFTDEERETFLQTTSPHSASLTLAFAKTLQEQDRNADALSALEMYIQAQSAERTLLWGKDNISILLQSLRVAEKLREKPDAYFQRAQRALRANPSATILDAAATYLGEENVKDLETYLRENRREEFFQYLRQRRRFEECWQMIERDLITSDTGYHFAVEQKQAEPEKAAEAFVRRIDAHKNTAKNEAYAIVTQTLKHLHSIDKNRAEAIVEELRAMYKRRTNLMASLDGAFGKRR